MTKDKNKEMKKHSEKIVFPRHAVLPNIIVPFKRENIDVEDNICKLDVYGAKNKLDSYSNIYMRDGYKLVAYLCRSEIVLRGYVYAIPIESDPLKIQEYKSRDNLTSGFHMPKDTLPNFMLGIDGDNTPLSYLQASVLYHEFRDYGAPLSRPSWRREAILPFYDTTEEGSQRKWKMLKEEPEIIEPHFYYNEEKNPVVVFYTINDTYTITLKEYIHIFDKESYKVKVFVNAIAEADIEIVF